MSFSPSPEGDDCKDAGVRATHGAVADGRGERERDEDTNIVYVTNKPSP